LQGLHGLHGLNILIYEAAEKIMLWKSVSGCLYPQISTLIIQEICG